MTPTRYRMLTGLTGFSVFGTEISHAEQKPDGTVVFDERYGKI
ncbi:hypothetical protein DEHRE_09520 [Dehalobacter restrictus DSM 9455]|uniref:Uncharacterized protein n=1 Tax=Dehalobacter restrictus (strain DSM 9455 / PER-K23) TaxID=871738 RepID=A0ABN4BVR6_DEHRP|nr:hypothetical protein DEHRE_09520 [Dehalobacter restrictus DSM 9455]